MSDEELNAIEQLWSKPPGNDVLALVAEIRRLSAYAAHCVREERERCAGIAVTAYEDEGFDAGYHIAGREIATRIMGQCEESAHPEDYCHECHRPNLSWFTDSKLWNAVMRKDGDDVFSIVCPVCFVRRAREAGITVTGWELVPKNIQSPEAEIRKGKP